MSPSGAKVVWNLLRWGLVLLLTVAGLYSAIRLPLFEAIPIPEGLRLVLSVEFVGLIIVFVLLEVERLTGLGGITERALTRILVIRPNTEEGPVFPIPAGD